MIVDDIEVVLPDVPPGPVGDKPLLVDLNNARADLHTFLYIRVGKRHPRFGGGLGDGIDAVHTGDVRHSHDGFELAAALLGEQQVLILEINAVGAGVACNRHKAVVKATGGLALYLGHVADSNLLHLHDVLGCNLREYVFGVLGMGPADGTNLLHQRNGPVYNAVFNILAGHHPAGQASFHAELNTDVAAQLLGQLRVVRVRQFNANLVVVFVGHGQGGGGAAIDMEQHSVQRGVIQQRRPIRTQVYLIQADSPKNVNSNGYRQQRQRKKQIISGQQRKKAAPSVPTFQSYSPVLSRS